MRLSIVATLYRSETYIEPFCARATAAARALVGDDYEIILVNDGSPDDSLACAIGRMDADPHVVVVDLARNFGHYAAIFAGLAQAQGEQIFLIDVDLEEEPEWLGPFHAQLERAGCDVVYGVQRTRKGGLFERFSGALFYLIFHFVVGRTLPKNFTTARLMSRRYVEAFLLHEEREIFLAGLFLITGFAQEAQVVTKHATSPSTYNLRRKIGLFVNSITSFSNAPLVAIFYAGLLISGTAILYIGFLVLNWLWFNKPPMGWTSVMASVWLLQGMNTCFVGIIGIYLAKVFSEAKRRPRAIVRQVHRKFSDQGDGGKV